MTRFSMGSKQNGEAKPAGRRFPFSAFKKTVWVLVVSKVIWKNVLPPRQEELKRTVAGVHE